MFLPFVELNFVNPRVFNLGTGSGQVGVKLESDGGIWKAPAQISITVFKISLLSSLLFSSWPVDLSLHWHKNTATCVQGSCSAGAAYQRDHPLGAVHLVMQSWLCHILVSNIFAMQWHTRVGIYIEHGDAYAQNRGEYVVHTSDSSRGQVLWPFLRSSKCSWDLDTQVNTCWDYKPIRYFEWYPDYQSMNQQTANAMTTNILLLATLLSLIRFLWLNNWEICDLSVLGARPQQPTDTFTPLDCLSLDLWCNEPLIRTLTTQRSRGYILWRSNILRPRRWQFGCEAHFTHKRRCRLVRLNILCTEFTKTDATSSIIHQLQRKGEPFCFIFQ